MDKINKFIKEHIFIILASLLIAIAIILLIILIKDELIILLSILFILILLTLMEKLNIRDSNKNYNIIKEDAKTNTVIIPVKPINDEKNKKEELVNIKDNNIKKEKINEKEKIKEEIKKEFLKEQTQKNDNKSGKEKNNYIDSIKVEAEDTINRQNIIKSFDIKEDKIYMDSKETAKESIIKADNEIKKKNTSNRIENLDVNNSTKKRIAEGNINKEKKARKENLKVISSTVIPTFMTNYKKDIIIAKEEKLIAAYIQYLINKIDSNQELDFYKDEHGYINVHLNTDFLKFKIGKNEKYFIIPSSIKVPLETKPHNEENKNKAFFNNIEDLDLIKTYIEEEYNKDKLKEKIISKKGKHFKLHPIEVKEIINEEKEKLKKKRINKKIEHYMNLADNYHRERKYENEIAILNSAIGSLKDNEEDIYLLKRKLSMAYESKLKEEKRKEKRKVKEKKMNNI